MRPNSKEKMLQKLTLAALSLLHHAAYKHIHVRAPLGKYVMSLLILLLLLLLLLLLPLELLLSEGEQAL